jgi:hypothetical protein
MKVWNIQRLDLLHEILTDVRHGWLRVLMANDRCIYAGCRRVIKVDSSLV